jgi:hypothetical protein
MGRRRKEPESKVKVRVLTDSVFANGQGHPYGSEVKLSEEEAKPLLKGGLVEKVGK